MCRFQGGICSARQVTSEHLDLLAMNEPLFVAFRESDLGHLRERLKSNWLADSNGMSAHLLGHAHVSWECSLPLSRFIATNMAPNDNRNSVCSTVWGFWIDSNWGDDLWTSDFCNQQGRVRLLPLSPSPTILVPCPAQRMTAGDIQ